MAFPSGGSIGGASYTAAMSAWLLPGWRIALGLLALARRLGRAAAAAAAADPVDGLGPGRACRGLAGLLALMLALVLLASASTTLRAAQRLAQQLTAALEGRDLLVTGVAVTMPQIGESGTRFQFDVEQATLQGRPVELPPRLALGWYSGCQDEAQLGDPRGELRAGQRWRLPLRLKRPHGAKNPHGIDAELWWFEQGLGATGYVRVAAGGADAQRLADGVGHPVERLRQALREAIERQVGDAHAAGVLAALVVGDQAAIERDDWDLFRQTGVAHLMSISGVHITMFAWLAGLVIGHAWRRSGRLMLWLPTPQEIGRASCRERV
jgi:competence protein ComEC